MDNKLLADAVRFYGKRACFPEEGIDSLCLAAEKLSEKALGYLVDAGTNYLWGEKLTLAMQEEFEEIANSIHPYEAQMLYYISFLPVLEEKYCEKELPETFVDRVLFDMRAKLLECHTVYGIWGSFVAIWFSRFFNFTLYGIGRLEFAPFHAEFAYEGQGITVQKGDFAIDVHIPSGAPLAYEDVMGSYRKAAEFFGCNVFVCESWMLYPAHGEMLKGCGNLMAFYKDYDVVESGESREDLWRIFGAMHEESPEDLPRDTTLRRVYAERLEKGMPVGWGKGIFVLK